MEHGVLLRSPKFWDPVLFLSRLLQNVSIFLLMERLEYFLIRITFLSMGEPFLIPTEFNIFFKDILSVRSRYDVAVIIAGYHYGIFSIRFLWKKNLPLTCSRCLRGAKLKGLFVFYKNLFCLFFGFDGIISMVPELFFWIDIHHVFAEVTPFLLTLILLDIGNS